VDMYAIAGAPNLPIKPHSTAHLITNDKAGMHNSVAGIVCRIFHINVLIWIPYQSLAALTKQH